MEWMIEWPMDQAMAIEGETDRVMDGGTDRAMGGVMDGSQHKMVRELLQLSIVSQRELAECLAADRKMYSRDVNGDREGNRESGDVRQ